jgi:hypothetical protein
VAAGQTSVMGVEEEEKTLTQSRKIAKQDNEPA